MLNFARDIKVKIPLIISIIFICFSIYWLLRSGFNAWYLLESGYTGVLKTGGYFGHPYNISFFQFALSGIVLLFGFLLSTRVKLLEKRYIRRLYFYIVSTSVILTYAWLLLMATHSKVIPYLDNLIADVEVEGNTLQYFVNDSSTSSILIMFIPLFIVGVIIYLLFEMYQSHTEQIKEKFYEFNWSGKWLQRFSNMEKTSQLPDMELGENSETSEMVVQPGKDRTLNNIIIGSIGTGKTAALGLPIINQDLHHITQYINNFPKLFKKEDYDTENVKGAYMNGISIIEPSNDLCKKSLKLVQAHNVPEEAVTYINPLDPNTPSINPMKGPVEKVAEAFAQVIEGLNDSGDSGNFYFEQAQRNHLKHYVYLLKMHDTEKEVTFDMLLDMYNNSQVVRQMHIQLKERIPNNIDEMENRDERNRWKIIQQVDEWFDQNLLPVTVRNGGGQVVDKVKEGKYRGQDKYYDAKAEHVQGLRNILNDIGSNPLIRRVMFGQSNFDFDVHLERGGVLLVNTAKGEMNNLSNVFGKIVLLSLQNAVFRREPEISPYHHIMIDEAPDYLYQPFREFPAQSRKYKTIITIICQTIAQMADRYGEHYLTTLVGTLRHRMIYGDVPSYDAKYFSEMFGEKYTYEESTNDQVVSALQEDPRVRTGSTYQKTLDSSLSASDVMYQDAFQCAVKIVSHNKPLPVQQIQANFVPKGEFETSKIKVKGSSAEVWLKERRQFAGDLSHSEVSEEAERDVGQMALEEKELDEQEINNTISQDFQLLEHGGRPKGDPELTVDYEQIPSSNDFNQGELNKSSEVESYEYESETQGKETKEKPVSSVDWSSAIPEYEKSKLDLSQSKFVEEVEKAANKE